MVLLHLPTLTKLRTIHPPVSSGDGSCFFATATSSANAAYQITKQPLHRNNRPVEISLRTTRPNYKLVSEQVSVREFDNMRETMEEGFENETEAVIQRLQTAVETVIDSEVRKFTKRRVDEELSSEDRRTLMEEMSREIVRKFWEKPVRYLASGDGNREQRLKHLHIFVRMLEQSCPNNPRRS